MEAAAGPPPPEESPRLWEHAARKEGAGGEGGAARGGEGGAGARSGRRVWFQAPGSSSLGDPVTRTGNADRSHMLPAVETDCFREGPVGIPCSLEAPAFRAVSPNTIALPSAELRAGGDVPVSARGWSPRAFWGIPHPAASLRAPRCGGDVCPPARGSPPLREGPVQGDFGDVRASLPCDGERSCCPESRGRVGLSRGGLWLCCVARVWGNLQHSAGIEQSGGSGGNLGHGINRTKLVANWMGRRRPADWSF